MFFERLDWSSRPDIGGHACSADSVGPSGEWDLAVVDPDGLCAKSSFYSGFWCKFRQNVPRGVPRGDRSIFPASVIMLPQTDVVGVWCLGLGVC